MNLEFADINTSPLDKQEVIKFSGLDFYPINKELYIVANFNRTPNEKPFDMLTTTSRLAKYVKYGVATFKINDKKHSLSIYQNIELSKKPEYVNSLFLPFTDETTGKGSYFGGRYIDLTKPKEKDSTIIIDFNKAYNPYCAYNPKYSCPIPPKENHIFTEIKAGVKEYNKLSK